MSSSMDTALLLLMGGDGSEGTNPEQLFAAGYAACFANAMRSSARRDGDESVVDGATVILRTSTSARSARAASSSRCRLTLRRRPGQDDAEALVAKAHERCPTNATRGNIEVELAVTGRA